MQLRGDLDKVSEDLRWYVEDSSASFAVEVWVGRRAQPVSRGPMTQMCMDHNTELLQLFEIPVNRGHIDRRLHTGDRCSYFLCVQVPSGSEQHIEEHTPRPSYPPAVVAKQVQHILHRRRRMMARSRPDVRRKQVFHDHPTIAPRFPRQPSGLSGAIPAASR